MAITLIDDDDDDDDYDDDVDDVQCKSLTVITKSTTSFYSDPIPSSN
jgi:hypothetical protein